MATTSTSAATATAPGLPAGRATLRWEAQAMAPRGRPQQGERPGRDDGVAQPGDARAFSGPEGAQ